MRPVTCLITDRHRFGDDEDALVARVSSAARGGVALVQIRERDLDGGALMRLVRRCLDAVRSTSARVVVNDRLDVALAAGAHGVHLRADSMPSGRARAIAPRGFLIGRSVHSADEARVEGEPDEVNYLIFGAVFPTSSKPGVAPAGVAALQASVLASRAPVLAVGGVSVATATEVARAGAAGLAGIGMFATPDCAALHQALAAAFDGVRE